jgi:polysaccharide pyruvyl transferase WcaK-like protein
MTHALPPSEKFSSSSKATGAPRVLLIGYNGANNTGAEALLLSDIEDLRALLGPQARLTVPTLNEANLRRYLQEGPYLDIVPLSPIFFSSVWKLVREHDLVILVEGSAYMDTWTSALLWLFLWATHCASVMSKPCLAYAVDAGSMSAFNQRLTRREASKTDLIITRSQAAAERLRSWGVSAPLEATADNAFNFLPNPTDAEWFKKVWPEVNGIVGLAAVNFYLFPVMPRLFGPKEYCYRWPYYFTHTPERIQAARELAKGYAELADHIIEKYGKAVALIAMEQLDEPLARQIVEQMKHPERARVFSAREYNASQMTVLLRSLELLITSRYHAGVLSLAAQVPQLAVGHDLRLETLYRELRLWEQYFHKPTTPRLVEDLAGHIRQLLTDPSVQKEMLRQGYQEHLAKAKRNRELLRGFVQTHGWATQEVVA